MCRSQVLDFKRNRSSSVSANLLDAKYDRDFISQIVIALATQELNTVGPGSFWSE